MKMLRYILNGFDSVVSVRKKAKKKKRVAEQMERVAGERFQVCIA